MKNSFIQNVNYIASLDNNYGDQAYLLKNNLTLMNTANDIVLSFKYFDFDKRTVKEIKHSKTGVLYSGLGLILQEFVNKINSAMGIRATASYQLLNLTIGFSITITSNVSDIKVNELNFNAKKTQDQVELYNLYGDVRNTLKILPTLAMLDNSILNGFAIAGKYIDNILTVSDNIDDVVVVSDNIHNVNNTGQNIESVNKVSSNMNTVRIVSLNINNVNIVGKDIENVNTVAENIESVKDISNNIETVKPIALNMDAVLNVHNNMNSVITDANNIGNINIVADDLSEVGFSNLIDMGSISDPVQQDPTGISLIETVAVNINDVRINANNIANIKTNADNIATINIVANNIDNVNLTGASSVGINIIAPKIDKVETVADNIADVNTVADISTDVTVVSANITDINQVAANKANINVVSSNIADVNSVAANIVDIQNAEENAQIAIDKAAEALASEDKAHKWAQNQENEIVQGTFGVDDEYSAYHWAKKAEAAAGGHISLNSLYDINTTGILDGGLIRFNESTGLWEAYDFTHNDVIGFDINSGTSVAEGQLAWNNTEKTLDLGLSGGSTLQLGQESVRLVRNNTSDTIAKGTIVMLNGSTGSSNRINIKPFTGGFNEAIYCYGIAAQDILAGADGIINTEGKVKGIDTTGTSVGEVWVDGDILYAKPNGNGLLTNVVPDEDELRMPIAVVVNSHTDGTLEIRFAPINENLYYTKEQNDILLANKVPLTGDFILDLGGIV